MLPNNLPSLDEIPEPPAIIPFVKAHANGNDFLILQESITRNNHAALTKKLCHRTQGIGADGIEFLDHKPDGSLFIRLFNADGSEAELSGNGTRCVSAHLAATESLTQVTLHTHGGPRACTVVEAHHPHYLIQTAMGIPRLLPRTIDIPGVGLVEGVMVNVGNPHFVLFTESETFETNSLPWQQLGALIAASPLFPHGTNVEFVRILSPTEIAFRIHERGVGPTQSSGTGTCASSAAAITYRDTARTLIAHAEGGPQKIDWATPEAPMLLTGPAEIICKGEASL